MIYKARINLMDASLSFTKTVASAAPVQNAQARWIALSRVKGLGCVNFKKLAAHFTDATKAFSASAAELAAVPELDHSVVEGLLNFSEWEAVADEVRRAERAGAKIVPFADPNYPARLRMIADPPPLL